LAFFVTILVSPFAQAQKAENGVCPQYASGSVVSAPQEIRSKHGVLRVSISLRNSTGPAGEQRYCYVDERGRQAPTLRLKPGDLLILKLKNELTNRATSMASPTPGETSCASRAMLAGSTNLHFHGLMIPPACHQDDVLNTAIQPASSYEYRVRIPRTQPPGLYWYHPHLHGHSEEQVLGGASGALIVEGIERFNPLVAGLPERILVIRDQARPSAAISAVNRDAPSKDVSINLVPVPYPDYPLAVIKTKPAQREFWRVLNASADTFLELHLLMKGRWQSMGLVSLDGVPLSYEGNEKSDQVQWRQDIPLPPGGRAEFLFDSPAQGGEAQLLTSGVDTVPFQGEDEPNFAAPANGASPIPDNDDSTPPRWIAKIVSTTDAPEPTSIIPPASPHVEGRTLPPLNSVRPVRERKLYFSEKVLDRKHPLTSTVFYITEEGQVPAAFDPAAGPTITVHQGDVEDWVIENRSQEIHTFHIHQTHFIVLAKDGNPVAEDYLRDSVAVPYWDGISPHYPSVTVRIDFRDPTIVGTFPYHCHILQHEDGGMMGTVRVLKKFPKTEAKR
jgi:FtsP/CotA-like multicopper oxidase with cupredoxin domain